jgi:hypothetical protein
MKMKYHPFKAMRHIEETHCYKLSMAEKAKLFFTWVKIVIRIGRKDCSDHE